MPTLKQKPKQRPFCFSVKGHVKILRLVLTVTSMTFFIIAQAPEPYIVITGFEGVGQGLEQHMDMTAPEDSAILDSLEIPVQYLEFSSQLVPLETTSKYSSTVLSTEELSQGPSPTWSFQGPVPFSGPGALGIRRGRHP
ncbi:hypothetical protein CB1_000490083 [Camelus ferus]|nr:hypothetical protein CB1_000490083 [Camelus ferus]